MSWYLHDGGARALLAALLTIQAHQHAREAAAVGVDDGFGFADRRARRDDVVHRQNPALQCATVTALIEGWSDGVEDHGAEREALWG
jgi:hypothetical protein